MRAIDLRDEAFPTVSQPRAKHLTAERARKRVGQYRVGHAFDTALRELRVSSQRVATWFGYRRDVVLTMRSGETHVPYWILLDPRMASVRARMGEILGGRP